MICFLQKPEYTKSWFHIWYLTYTVLVRKLDLPTLIQKQQHIFCPKTLMIDWRRFIHLPVGHVTYTLSYTVKLKSEKKMQRMIQSMFFLKLLFQNGASCVGSEEKKNFSSLFFPFCFVQCVFLLWSQSENCKVAGCFCC